MSFLLLTATKYYITVDKQFFSEITQLNSALNSLNDSMTASSQVGRKTLVVIGAGCSAKLGIWTMSDIYAQLYDKLNQKLIILKRESAEPKDYGMPLDTIESLLDWLNELKETGGPRSAAARVLRTLQTAHTIDNAKLRRFLQSLWSEFTQTFLRHLREKVAIAYKPHGTVSKVSPSLSLLDPQPQDQAISDIEFHRLIANWVIDGRAHVVSLNFDGLTRAAIDLLLKSENSSGKSIILNGPLALDSFFCGTQDDESCALFPVVKIWGDVFHAICPNQRCPSHNISIPIYDLLTPLIIGDGPVPNDIDSIKCSDCGTTRQLQIFFAGYKEKEENTEAIVEKLWEYVAPQIGTIFVSGFSGQWDDAMVSFLASLGKNIQENSRRTSVFYNSRTPEDIYLVRELRRRGVDVITIKGIATDVARTLAGLQSSKASYQLRLKNSPTGCRAQQDELWRPLIRDKISTTAPVGYSFIRSDYLKSFEKLRQLGLWTRLHRADSEEEEHNRFRHSLGASHLAIYWLSAFNESEIKQFGVNHNILHTIAFTSALHHDLGHLPFTHLTEEIFHEINWTIDEWSKTFSHERAVFRTAWNANKRDVTGFIGHLSKEIESGLGECPPAVLEAFASDAIEGYSGIPFLDALINSPIDVDKLDYVFRDSKVLGQSVHLPHGDKERLAWIEQFVTSQTLLPSGLIGLSGASGEHARQFLEERRWLYKYMYYRPAYRVVERIARSLLILWLVYRIPNSLCLDGWSDPIKRSNSFALPPSILISDIRALKGKRAQNLLWEELCKSGGEPDLIMHISSELLDDSLVWKAIAPAMREWIVYCKKLLLGMLLKSGSTKRLDYNDILENLKSWATWSQCLYIKVIDIRTVSEIIRHLEMTYIATAVFDVVSVPRMLAYPTRRRLSMGKGVRISDCYAVPHHDPDLWGKRSSRWIPLSCSAYRDSEDQRCAQVMILAPRAGAEPDVKFMEDRFREHCARAGVKIFDEDPSRKV